MNIGMYANTKLLTQIEERRETNLLQEKMAQPRPGSR